jgi:hypothetical protein
VENVMRINEEIKRLEQIKALGLAYLKWNEPKRQKEATLMKLRAAYSSQNRLVKSYLNGLSQMESKS